jgi:CRP-like cAMP-binding protein
MSLETDIAVLRQVPFFASFGDEHLRLLAFGGENRRYRPGQALFSIGDTSDGGMVVLTGEVVLLAEDGQSQTFAAGSLFGQRALLARTKRYERAVAGSDCEVLMIRRTLFLRMLAEFPDLAARLHEEMSAELQALTDDAGVIVSGFAPER